jgi:hypothetical protein
MFCGLFLYTFTYKINVNIIFYLWNILEGDLFQVFTFRPAGFLYQGILHMVTNASEDPAVSIFNNLVETAVSSKTLHHIQEENSME